MRSAASAPAGLLEQRIAGPATRPAIHILLGRSYTESRNTCHCSLVVPASHSSFASYRWTYAQASLTGIALAPWALRVEARGPACVRTRILVRTRWNPLCGSSAYVDTGISEALRFHCVTVKRLYCPSLTRLTSSCKRVYLQLFDTQLFHRCLHMGLGCERRFSDSRTAGFLALVLCVSLGLRPRNGRLRRDDPNKHHSVKISRSRHHKRLVSVLTHGSQQYAKIHIDPKERNPFALRYKICLD
jgi:hypothetical protein